MLTHIGALVGCYCGNPRAAQITAEGFFLVGSVPFATSLLAWRISVAALSARHTICPILKTIAFCDNRAAAAKNLYNVFRAGFIGRPEKANLCTDSTGCAGRTGGGIAIGTSYCSF
jgi:hypothetical protein